MYNQRFAWMHGKGLGASSLVNYMLYIRGNAEDYNRWAQASNTGWSYADVVKSFKRFVNVDLPYVNTSHRIVGGELDITNLPYKTKIIDPIIQGCEQYGMEPVQDYNEGTVLGVSYMQSNQKNGRRCHSAKAFLRPIKRRKNLVIRTGALVTKLKINKQAKTAEGVEYRVWGKTHHVKAKDEVILSAGAFRSPQLLMLFGIGPKEHIQEFDIDVVQDLPVGETLYDHVVFMGLIFKANASVGAQFTSTLNPINWGRYLFQGKGPLTVPALILERLSFVKTAESNETLPIPDVELLLTSGSLSTDYGLYFQHQLNTRKDAYNAVWGPYRFKHVWRIMPMLLYPKSKGYMRLRSRDPSDTPKLYANYFTDPENKDIKTMIAAIRIAQQVAKTPALAKFGSELHLGAVPGCKKEVVVSDGFWECQLRHLAWSIWHQVGTCKMGPAGDPTAVVDPTLKVDGIKGLRVADASIMPTEIGGLTNGPSILVGQKAAEFIRGE